MQRTAGLIQLWEKIAGRQRTILGKTPEEMYVPIKIDEGLYFEGKLDTEALLTVMTKKVPEPAGYDYNQLIIQCTARELVMAGTLLMISNEDMSEADGMEQSS